MKLNKYSLALMLGIGTLSSCDDKLDLINPNSPTVSSFGNSAADLEEAVIAAYHHIRMEGTYARVGYTIDMCRGDEVWNSSQVWYMPFDDMNEPITDEIGQWSWRDWFYAVKATNYVLARTTEEESKMSNALKRVKGQAQFLRALAYYNLACYYQNPMIITDYSLYDGELEGLQVPNSDLTDKKSATAEDLFRQYDKVLDLVEEDLKSAINLLPSRDEQGQWALGRATQGAAAGYLARTLMLRHKYSEALSYLDDLTKGVYGHYELTKNYGDNFREGAQFENNEESLFEVQFLDYGSQGSDDEWTPVNISKNASQGHAVESNCGPGDFGGWADLSAAPWLYHLFLEEKTTKGTLDPRLYWTIGTYEEDWNGFEYGNVCYGEKMKADENIVTNNNNGGLPIAKNTNFRAGLYSKVVTGLKCGINLRLMRFSDVLLRAAECENEVYGPTPRAFEWIDEVRTRAGLAKLDRSKFTTKEELFEQIANVERPKEFGCEYGRGTDLIRWGFFYDEGRLQQLKEHGTFRRTTDKSRAKEAVSYAEVGLDEELKSSYDTYRPGHEYLPLFQGTMDANPNLVGNSANLGIDNASYFKSKYQIHPVVK